MSLAKRIIICSTSDFDADYRLYKASVSLTNRGFKVTRLGRQRKSHITKARDGIKLMRLLFSTGSLFYAEMNIRLLLHLLFAKVDIIYSADLDTLPACRLAAAIRRKTVIFDSHEYYPEIPELKNRPAIKYIWQTIEKLFVPGITTGITVCQSIADIYKDKYGLNFLVIRNIPLEKRINEITHADINATPFTILYQGAINLGRGIEPMIKAMTHLPQCQLVIVGDGDITEDVKKLAKELKLDHRVKFEGKKPFDQLPHYMANAHIGLVLLENMGLNYYYSLPNRLFDFIQAGLPFIAMDFPEMAAIVRKYNVGLCVDNLEPEYLADVIKNIISKPELIMQWRDNMQVAAQELTWENEFEQLKINFENR